MAHPLNLLDSLSFLIKDNRSEWTNFHIDHIQNRSYGKNDTHNSLLLLGIMIEHCHTNDLNPFRQPLPALPLFYSEGLELPVPVALAHAEKKLASREDFQRSRLFRNINGMVQGAEKDGGSQVHTWDLSGQLSKQEKGLQHCRVGAGHVVLRDEQRFVVAFIGQLRQLGHLPAHSDGVKVHRVTGELNTKPHRLPTGAYENLERRFRSLFYRLDGRMAEYFNARRSLDLSTEGNLGFRVVDGHGTGLFFNGLNLQDGERISRLIHHRIELSLQILHRIDEIEPLNAHGPRHGRIIVALNIRQANPSGSIVDPVRY